jgi:hypothetical protein
MSDRGALLQYKGNRCASCGLSVQEMLERHGTFERMFEFHHIDPTNKDRQYRRLMAQRLSRRQIDEMDKCVLLCRHCHGVIHAQNIRAQLTLSIDFRSRVVSQSVSGWVKLDRVSKTLGFITNEPYRLHPCRVEMLDGTELFLTVGEIGSKVLQWMGQMESIQDLKVFRLQDDRLVYSMRYVGHRSIAIQHLIQFPVIEIEYQEQDHPREVVFLRNGFALLKSGDVLSAGTVKYTLNLEEGVGLLADA